MKAHPMSLLPFDDELWLRMGAASVANGSGLEQIDGGQGAR